MGTILRSKYLKWNLPQVLIKNLRHRDLATEEARGLDPQTLKEGLEKENH